MIGTFLRKSEGISYKIHSEISTREKQRECRRSFPRAVNKFIAGEVGRSVKDYVCAFVRYCIGLLFMYARQ